MEWKRGEIGTNGAVIGYRDFQHLSGNATNRELRESVRMEREILTVWL